MRFFTIIIVFLLVGVFFIISEKGLNVASSSDLKILKSDYSSWLLTTAKNSAFFVGQAIKMEWLPETNMSDSSLGIIESNDSNKSE
ncbi:MAG: hypothetical protein AABW73_00505 [Nanoarchaeota archaeon]